MALGCQSRARSSGTRLILNFMMSALFLDPTRLSSIFTFQSDRPVGSASVVRFKRRALFRDEFFFRRALPDRACVSLEILVERVAVSDQAVEHERGLGVGDRPLAAKEKWRARR